MRRSRRITGLLAFVCISSVYILGSRWVSFFIPNKGTFALFRPVLPLTLLSLHCCSYIPHAPLLRHLDTSQTHGTYDSNDSAAPSDTHVNLVLILYSIKFILTTSHKPTEHLCFHSLSHDYPLVLNRRGHWLTDVIILVDICVPRCV